MRTSRRLRLVVSNDRCRGPDARAVLRGGRCKTVCALRVNRAQPRGCSASPFKGPIQAMQFGPGSQG
jgi:hypothetical protein